MSTLCPQTWVVIRFSIVLLVLCSCRDDQTRTWSVYKADPESSSSSTLKQINRENVKAISLAWTFYPNDSRKNSRPMNSECNPIVIDGVMYATSARHRLYAINARTGQQLWTFDPFEGGEGGGVYRGVAYWEDGEDKRILYTAGDNLFAQNAITGELITTFGNNGKVSMNEGLRGDPKKISVIPTSPGIVFGDLLILGAEVSELYGAEPGYIRAYDVRTGKLEWTFHTIPHPGEPGYETWSKDAWKYVGGVNDWAGMSLDKKRGMVFLALGSPSYDFYGGDRIGQNLYGNSVVALDARTGKYKWHFQTVHHDLWDYDLPAPPNLVTLERDGKKIDAVAQTTKTGFLFVLDRDTGQPLFPVEERRVPASYVPGEQAWPTQPFPLKPAPYSRQNMTEDDLTSYSPAAHDSLLKKFRSLRYEGLFTPPDPKGTLMIPGTRGGSNWGGGAFDRETGIFYVKSSDSPEIDHLRKVSPEKSFSKQSPFNQGKAIYMKHCASCHGRDRNGNEPDYPSLRNIKDKLSKDIAIKKIMEGSGRMPAFEQILQGSEDALVAFLYDVTAGRPSREEADLFEVHTNRQAVDESPDSSRDTAVMYLNVTPFSHFNDIEGRPALKPPWGHLNAINLNTGEYAWRVVIGNRPELQETGAPETGAEGYGGPIVTAGGLLFIGGTHDKKFRAYDKENGELLWETTLPAVANATPCTYFSDGKQYVAISVAGDEKNPAGSIMAFALP
jgi:quinoprotein glucose dehydrogenase